VSEKDEKEPAAPPKPAPAKSQEPEQPPATPELGPVIGPDGEVEAFESVGSQTGVQPLEAADIPEAGQ
jgi:hypothetical protein